MKCKKYDKYGSLFLSGELSKEDEQYFQKHLSECKECAEKIAFESDIISGNGKEIMKVPAGLDDKVLKSLKLKKEPAFINRYISYSIAATIILAVIISFSVFKNTHNINIGQVNITEKNITDTSQSYDIFDDDLLLAYDEIYDEDFDTTYDLAGDEQDLSYDDDLYENLTMLESIY